MQIDTEVAIVGTGFSGIAMAIQLKRHGIEDFVLLEKAADLGGTWRENTYPGAACDVPSHLYSYSFEPNPSWSRTFSPQSEILEYLRHVATKYGVTPHMRFNAKVEQADFDVDSGRWIIRIADGRTVRARFFCLGNGALHIPSWPNIPGRESFAGKSMHSALWDHSYDLDGKTVAVIGTGASAIQFVPQVAPRVAKLHLFQRTPPWILPKPDRPFRDVEKRLFARFPFWERIYRWLIYWGLEVRAAAFILNTSIMIGGEAIARRYIKKLVENPALRDALTPKYRMGCKRVLMSNDYLQVFNRENVELVTTAIESITPTGIRTCDGVERKVDCILYGTGFDVTNYLTPVKVTGTHGRTLNDVWNGAAQTFLGITVSGFPNMFLLMGPNTGLGHNSMIFMIEAQARYAMQCIALVRRHRLVGMDVRQAAQDEFQKDLVEKLGTTVWQTGGCHSWYQTADGRNPTIWPGFTFDYWLRTRRMDVSDYALLGEGA